MRKTGAALTAGAVLAFGAYAVGSQAGDGVAESRDGAPNGQNVAFRGGPGGPGLSELAQKLGGVESQLRALDNVRAQQQPPSSRDPRDELAAKLASKLGIDRSKVEDVLGQMRPERPGRPPRRAQIEKRLAKKLGISVEKVRRAFRQVKPG